MTSQFVTAAALMARVLGAEDYRFVVVDHPISSATDAALSERAVHAVRTAADLLLS